MTVIVGKAETLDLSGGDFCGVMVQVRSGGRKERRRRKDKINKIKGKRNVEVCEREIETQKQTEKETEKEREKETEKETEKGREELDIERKGKRSGENKRGEKKNGEQKK